MGTADNLQEAARAYCATVLRVGRGHSDACFAEGLLQQAAVNYAQAIDVKNKGPAQPVPMRPHRADCEGGEDCICPRRTIINGRPR